MKQRSLANRGSPQERAIAIFGKHGGILRTSQALRAGIHPATLYAMRDSGVLEVMSRGVYRLADSPPLGSPDLVTVATRVPAGVICLISALAFHEITTQIPHCTCSSGSGRRAASAAIPADQDLPLQRERLH